MQSPCLIENSINALGEIDLMIYWIHVKDLMLKIFLNAFNERVCRHVRMCIVRGHMADFTGGFLHVAEMVTHDSATFNRLSFHIPHRSSCCRNHVAFNSYRNLSVAHADM